MAVMQITRYSIPTLVGALFFSSLTSAAVIIPNNPDVVRLSATQTPSTTTASFGLHTTNTALSPTQSAEMAQRGNCSAPQMDPDPRCFEELKVMDYLDEWWSNNSAICNGIDFAKCYQFYTNASLGQGCSVNALGGCSTPDARQFSDQRVFYVLWNIYAINNYWTNFYQAIGNAEISMSLKIEWLVQLFDPQKDKNFGLDQLFLVLTGLFAFARVPGIIKLAWWPDFVADSLLAGVSSMPTIGRFLFPATGSTESQLYQGASIKSRFSDLVQAYQNNVSTALGDVNSNYTNFRLYAATTIFSNPILSQTNMTNDVRSVFGTYIVSQLLSGNQIYIATSPGNPCSDNSGNPIPRPANGICGDNWYDPTTNTSYSLTDQKDLTRNMTSNMKDLFNGITTPEALFRGSASCNGGNGGPSGVLTVSPQNGTNMSAEITCLSSAQVCPFNQKAVWPEFTNSNCKNQKTYAVPNCADGSDGRLVPAGFGGYLGDVSEVCYH